MLSTPVGLCRACLRAAAAASRCPPVALALSSAPPSHRYLDHQQQHGQRRRFHRRHHHHRRYASSAASSSYALEVTDPLVLYDNLVRSGRIQYDESQVRILVQLRRLHADLLDYRPSMSLRHLLESSMSSKARSASSSSSSSIDRDAPPPRILPDFTASRSLVRALTHEDDVREDMGSLSPHAELSSAISYQTSTHQSASFSPGLSGQARLCFSIYSTAACP